MRLFFVKFAHTLVFVVESVAILYIFYGGMFDIRDRWLLMAVVLVVAEGIIFFGNGWHCPLTEIARRCGAEHDERLTVDIFLPRWAIPMVQPVCGTLATISLLLLLWRLLAG